MHVCVCVCARAPALREREREISWNVFVGGKTGGQAVQIVNDTLHLTCSEVKNFPLGN